MNGHERARTSALDLSALRTLTGSNVGTVDVACPICGPECRTPSNRNRKVLRIWDDGGFVTYKCARCEASGWARDGEQRSVPARLAPKPSRVPDDRRELARFLWSKSLPLVDSLAEMYLRRRQCFIKNANLRFLPGRNVHPPAMVARFGDGTVTGIHLTKLRGDGIGKAGTEKDKIMIGPSVGQPIIVQDNPERGELLIAEGIEDAASLALCTGWSAWAAGAAGRIPSILPASERFSKVFVSVDNDRAGRLALVRARAVRRNIVPLHIAKTLGLTVASDANKALIEYGADVLLAAIEWCDAQAAHARGEIGFHGMQNAMARADGVFRAIATAQLDAR